MVGSYYGHSHGFVRHGAQKPCGLHVAASTDHHSAHTTILEHSAAGSTAAVDHSAHRERQVFTKAIPTGHPEGEAREAMEEVEWEPEMGVGLRLLRAVRSCRA